MNTDDEETVKNGTGIQGEIVNSEEKRDNTESTETPSTQKSNVSVNIDINNHELDCDSKHQFACNKLPKHKQNVDNQQMSLEGILGLVDEMESQVEHFRDKIKRLEEEKSSLQSTVHFISQMVSQSSNGTIKPSTVLSTNNIITQNKGKIFCNIVTTLYYNSIK